MQFSYEDRLRYVHPSVYYLNERWLTDDGRQRIAEVVSLLERGVEDWGKPLIGFIGTEEVTNARDLRFANIPNLKISGKHFKNAELAFINLQGSILRDADFTGAQLNFANLHKTKIWNGKFNDADLSRAYLTEADFANSDFRNASLPFANFSGAYLESVSFYNAILSGVNFTNTILYQVDIRKSKLSGIVYLSKHEALLDYSDDLIIDSRNKILNWSDLRKIGQLPLFGVSWSSLVISLFIINTIELLNNTKLVEVLNYPIEIPQRMSLILIDSILLVIGTTLFKLFCPIRIQEFTESRWVEDIGRPRLQYLYSSWQRKLIQIPTLIFSVIGGGLAIYLIMEQLLNAINAIADNL